MKSATRIALPIGLILIGTSASLAAMSPLEAYQMRMVADLAFQCAAWANVDDGRSIDKSEVGRLTNYGYDLALEVSSAMAMPSTDNYAALNDRAPADFWVGAQWTQANLAVNRGLEYNVPQADHSGVELLALRAANASANFTEQKCAKVGAP